MLNYSPDSINSGSAGEARENKGLEVSGGALEADTSFSQVKGHESFPIDLILRLMSEFLPARDRAA